MTKIVSIILSCAIALAVLTSCGSNPTGGEQTEKGVDGKASVETEGAKKSQSESQSEEEVPLNERRPMVYVEDAIYYEIDYVKSLPEGTELIGSIEKLIDTTELPDENFESNWPMAPLDASIYAGEDRSIIYIERADLEDGGYMVYSTDPVLTLR